MLFVRRQAANVAVELDKILVLLDLGNLGGTVLCLPLEKVQVSRLTTGPKVRTVTPDSHKIVAVSLGKARLDRKLFLARLHEQTALLLALLGVGCTTLGRRRGHSTTPCILGWRFDRRRCR